MAIKTRANDADVGAFLDSIENEQRREDALKVLRIMKSVTRKKPTMWGTSIVGFGSYHYKYASGQEGDWPLTGFSPRKSALTLYIMPGFSKYASLLKKLGKHTTGKSCLYIKRLEDIDIPTLKELIKLSVEHMKKAHP